MTYTCCPACNGKRRKATNQSGVYECARCGAIYGECYKGDSYALVRPWFTTETDIPQRAYPVLRFHGVGLRRHHPPARLVRHRDAPDRPDRLTG